MMSGTTEIRVPAKTKKPSAGMSIEITTRNVVTLPIDYDEVFITWLPTETKESVIAKSLEIANLGLKPVPHIASNKVKNIDDAREIADRLSLITKKALFIRGGGTREGNYASVRDLVATRAFDDWKIGVGGFPDGNGPLNYADSINLLETKAAYAHFVVTQWSLNRKAIARFLDDSPLPVYLGVPNRCSLKQLVRFAKVCGIENAVKGTLSNPLNIARFVAGFDPSYIVEKFTSHANLSKFHVYSFGNLASL